MTYRVIMTEPAERDLFQSVNWWGQYRSSEQALRWYAKTVPAINALADHPDRCPMSPESDLVSTGLRQLHFGLGRKATHRVVFTIIGQEVRVLRIRHAAQQSLTLEDLG